MMQNQKHLFRLPGDIHYLNCAYMSPLLISSEEAGMNGMHKKRNPATITKDDFFNEAEEIRELFGKIAGCNASETALIPSASYGLATVARNLPLNNGINAITVGAEFPSDYYTLARWCKQHNKELIVIDAPDIRTHRGKKWNEILLDAIDKATAVVMISSVHWSDGTMYDLEAIGKRCKETNTVFVVDGTQSVGALPIDVRQYNIDALICAGYKWLFGPYSTGLAYYSDSFHNGFPMEESWMHRSNASEFARLTEYTDTYLPGAARFQVGEYSNFILNPMLLQALHQVYAWTPGVIQYYCAALIDPLIHFVHQKGWWMEDALYRGNHLFGLQLPSHIAPEKIIHTLREKNIYVSQRGSVIRISPHLYNTPEDISMLMEVLDTFAY